MRAFALLMTVAGIRGKRLRETGRLTTTRTELNQAAELSNETGPPHSRWITYYNAQRPHSALAGRTPDETYGATEMEKLAA